MSSLEIRPACAEDLHGMANVFIRCYAAPPWNEAWSFESAGERLDAIVGAKHFRGLIALDPEVPPIFTRGWASIGAAGAF